MRLRTLLVDDEPLALERLLVFFQDIPDAQIVGTARDGREAADSIRRLQPDLVLLDIQMPEQNGLRVASTIPAEERPEIVFVTAFEQYAPDAFEIEATDYLLKPVRFDRLWQAVERAKRRKRLRIAGSQGEESSGAKREEGLWVPTRSGAVFVAMDAIEWIEAQRDYVMLHTAARSHILRVSMRTLEQRLGTAPLMRVHRSAFARPDNVVEVHAAGRTITSLVLRDGATVQVGPSYAKAVARRLGMAD